MKRFKIISLILISIFSTALLLTGCNNNPPAENPEVPTGNILIAFFSRADESYSVGNIEKGNTHILAEMIAEQTQADMFHIQRSTPYPAVYRECTAEAQREKNANARPDLLQTLDIAEYDIIFIGSKRIERVSDRHMQ